MICELAIESEQPAAKEQAAKAKNPATTVLVDSREHPRDVRASR